MGKRYQSRRAGVLGEQWSARVSGDLVFRIYQNDNYDGSPFMFIRLDYDMYNTAP